MENASKALIMAAEILIGVMIISIGVYLFSTMGEYSADTTAQMQEAQINQFNNQFLRFYGTSSTGEGQPEPIRCTIHDIIGLANLAKKINAENGYIDEIPTSDPDTTYYIQIDLKIGVRTYKNIETYEQGELINLVKNNSIVYSGEGTENITADTIYFICSEMPEIGEVTRLVNYMKFVEI